jgi:hypothetical protein
MCEIMRREKAVRMSMERERERERDEMRNRVRFGVLFGTREIEKIYVLSLFNWLEKSKNRNLEIKY